MSLSRHAGDASNLRFLFPTTAGRVVLSDDPPAALDWLPALGPAIILIECEGAPATLIERMRAALPAAVIVLLVHAGSAAIIQALDAGADDAIEITASAEECMARVRARWSRKRGRLLAADASSAVMYCGDLAIHRASGQAARRGVPIPLTPAEERLVQCLVAADGKVVSHAALSSHLWPTTPKESREQLRVHLSAVRRKLEPDPSHPRYFVTVPRVGYRFVPDPAT